MIDKVSIKPGCISCKNCETVCPSIFHVQKSSQVISERYAEVWKEILQAEAMCPVQVINVKKSGNLSIDFKTSTLEEKRYLTDDTLELTFSTDNFSFIPGQYVSLQMKDWRGKFTRSYSIASATQTKFTLTVKLLHKGRGAHFLKKLKINSKVDFLGSNGDFVLQNTPKKKVFIATGTGLAPMIAMLEQTDKDIEKTVIFGVRNPDDVYYKEVLEKFENTQVIITVSRPDNTWTGNTGRVTQYLEGLPRDAEIYICGNPDMVDFVKDYLQEEGYGDDQVFHEEFTISPAVESSVIKEIFLNGTFPGIHRVAWGVIILSLAILPIILYNYPDLQSVYWIISWISVSFVMFIRPLADIFPKLLILRKMVTLRKAFGILSSSIVVSALLIKYGGNISGLLYYLEPSAWGFEYRAIFARLSEITAVILLLTSNHFSQQKLGVWWKRIQRTAYIYFFAGGLVAVQYGHEFMYYGSMILLMVLWILAKLKITLWK